MVQAIQLVFFLKLHYSSQINFIAQALMTRNNN